MLKVKLKYQEIEQIREDFLLDEIWQASAKQKWLLKVAGIWAGHKTLEKRKKKRHQGSPKQYSPSLEAVLTRPGTLGSPNTLVLLQRGLGSDNCLEYCSSFKLEHFKLVDELKDWHDRTCTPPSCSVTASMFSGHLKISCSNHDPYTPSLSAPTIQTWSKKNLHHHSTSEQFLSC